MSKKMTSEEIAKYFGRAIPQQQISNKEIVDGVCPECDTSGSIINKICCRCGKIFPHAPNEKREGSLSGQKLQKILEQRARTLEKEEERELEQVPEKSIQPAEKNYKGILKYMKDFLTKNQNYMGPISKIHISFDNGEVKLRAEIRNSIEI